MYKTDQKSIIYATKKKTFFTINITPCYKPLAIGLKSRKKTTNNGNTVSW